MLQTHRAQLVNKFGAEGIPQFRLFTVGEAHALFDKAYGRSRRARLWSKLTGRSSEILSLAEVAATTPITGGHAAGLCSVPVAQIQGSEGRTTNFDRRFNPADHHTKQRWVNVAIAWLSGHDLPAVELVQIGEIFFVQDGHHRVSVARAMGQTYIDAEVTVWEVGRPYTGPACRLVCQPA